MPLLEETHRDHRRVSWLIDAWQDCRYALRQFWRERQMVIAVVLTLGLGIGANTAIFSIVDGFRRPLPVADPEELVVLAAAVRGDDSGRQYRYSFAALQDLRTLTRTFSDVFAFSLQLSGIVIDGRASAFVYANVTGNYFTALGVRPAAGRLFRAGEGERASDEPAVVLGHSFWMRHFSGNPAVVGTQARIGGRSVRIVGVAPEGFRGTYSGLDADGYMPINALMSEEDKASDRLYSDRTVRWLTVLARRAPGVSIAEAQAATAVAAQRIERAHAEDRGIGVRVVEERWARPDPVGLLGPDSGASDQAAGFLLLCLAALVLTLACVNVANLLLVRATVRQRELAVRAALGASRSRLIRQALTEAAIFSLMGAVAGLVIGRMASRAMERSISVTSDFPIVLDFGLDWRVFAYALTAATLTGVAIAVWPTARASRANGVAALHDGARGSGGPGRQRVRALLAGGQVAGSLVLLIVAALFTRDLRNAATQDLGFDADHLLNVRMDPAWAGYDTSRTESFYKELEERIAAIPGVDSVGLAYSVPLGYYWDFGPIFVDGVRTDPDRQPLPVPRNYVSLRYFETMGIPLVEGRRFETTDGEADAPVAIVNEAMAARYWPGRSAVGQSFRLTSADGPALRVVGVAKNSKYIRIWERPTPYFYTPLSQYRSSMRVLQVRSSKALDQLAPLVEKEIRALGPDVPLTDVQTMREAMGSLGGLLLLRIGAVQATAMGLLGLALAVVGVYGVASYAAAQRTREIGLRIALGATARNILQMILRQGVMMVAGGTTAGLALALGMTAVLTSVLGMERAVDPLVFTLTTMLLCTVTLGACYLPARRATRIQPTLALRQE